MGGEGGSDVFVKTLTVELLGQMAPIVQCSGYTSCFSLDNPEHSACKPLLVSDGRRSGNSTNTFIGVL